jgi:nucleoid-associated protein YgaU
MSRCLYLALAALSALAGCNPAHGQDTPTGTSSASTAASPTNSSASAGDDVAALQAENAALKKQVADAAHTIAQLQAELAKAGIHHRAATASTTDSTPASVDNAAPAVADMSAAPASTNAASSGPQRALPLDATNANVTATAPGSPATDAGAGRTYTVVKGDSIWKIAHKMYPGDTKNGVDKIQEANKDAIGGKPLKIGQVLIIPQ